MTREEAIECLNFQNKKFFGGQSEALKIAIASLKTDEAYQLEYENRDFVEITEGMTVGEVLKAVLGIEDEQIVEAKYLVSIYPIGNSYDPFIAIKRNVWDAPYKKEGE